MKNITWSWDEPDEDERESEPGYPEQMAQAEQEMQRLDQALDPDGMDEQGQRAWSEYKKGELFICSGCREGWCDGCVPETEF